METTLTLDDAVMRELREEAARRGITPSALVEVAVERLLAERPAPKLATDELPPLPTWGGEALVDVADREALDEVIDAERPAPKPKLEADELPPLPSWNLGKPLVDVADREALYEVIDAERDIRLYGTRAY